MAQNILIVDDDPGIRSLLKDYLGEQGYRTQTAANGQEALYEARRMRPDLILLDIMMPEMGGYDFIRAYRKEAETPIILLTARVEEPDKVIGLELGADDYVTKPFGMRELLARVRAVLRRARQADRSDPDATLVLGDLKLDRGTRRVEENGRPVALTPSEFTLLSVLMGSPGRVYSRTQLLEHLHDDAADGVERTIDVHIRNLRSKIEPDPSRPRYVETVFGVGYRCAEE